MQNALFRKGLVIGIILLFVGTSVIPSTGQQIEKVSLLTSSGIKGSNQKTDSNDSGWQQINEDGFGSVNNVGPRGIEIFNDKLIMGTANYNQENDFVLNKTYSVRLFLNKLIHAKDDYAKGMKSDGCEIWSYDGQNLQQLVGPYGYVPSGFGDKNNTEVGVLIEYKGYLYAGTKNQQNGCEIWRTSDLQHWELVLDRGNGNRWNNAIWKTIVFNDTLYVGTENYGKGCEVFRTKTGNFNDWDVVVGDKATTEPGFGSKGNSLAWSMCVYDNWLYVGTDNLQGGGELWKSKDGETWKPVLAYMGWIGAKLHGAEYPRGFDAGRLNYRGGIRNMIVYNNELYCGFCGEDIHLNVWLSKVKLLTFREEGFRLKLRPLHYLESLGLELWKYNASKDKWSRVVGGLGKGNFSGGFGDMRNEYPWSMEVYRGYLYVGTARLEPINIVFSRVKNGLLGGYFGITVETPYGGGQVWRFDGKEWIKINENGFGDLYNEGIRAMKVYHNNLIAGTMNAKTGCELWKYNLS